MKNLQSWTPQTWDNFQASLDTTDWSVFVNSAQNVNELAGIFCTYEYINFCVDVTFKNKTRTDRTK